jgi:hypothetical protein
VLGIFSYVQLELVGLVKRYAGDLAEESFLVLPGELL